MEVQKTRPLLEVDDLKVFFPVRSGFMGKKTRMLKAVDGVSFQIEKGQTFGLVGESGCGKTTTGRALIGLNQITSGKVRYDGVELVGASKELKDQYRRKLQLIYQDPYSSLDPRQSIFQILKEAIIRDKEKHTDSEIQDRVDELLNIVELDPLLDRRFPHELSGGQRQRLGIARALACNPEFIVCDEPVSALDVSIQAQIINLFQTIQQKLGLTYLFVSHDLAVVRHISDYIAVMYLGRIVEITDAADLYDNPLHPYTRALLSAIPITDYDVEQQRQRIVLTGEVPSPINAPSGCAFHPRCKYATEKCKSIRPELRTISGIHQVACHNIETISMAEDSTGSCVNYPAAVPLAHGRAENRTVQSP